MNDYDISQAFKAIENELIDSMMRNFSRHRAEETKEGYNWSQWQAEQLKSLERYRKNNAEKFTKQFSEINDKISEMLRTARTDGNAEQEAKILQAIKDGFKLPDKPSASSTAEFFKANDRKLNALIKSTTDDLKRAETAILRMSNDKYRKAIYNAQVYANTGTGTYEKAVDMACRDMLRAGLNCVEYSNGARHTLSDYADMAIRTANKRAYLYGEGEKRAEWGISTVVVNSRQGGCPDCARYIGQVFIDDVYSNGKKSDGDYPLLSEAIAGGLFHPRCKDSTSTYYEGITTLKKVSQSELSEMRQNEALEQQKNNAENQAEKCGRIAKFSLDKDNQRIYRNRADVWQDKADEIPEKLDKSVANSAKSGIIDIQNNNYAKAIDIFNDYGAPEEEHITAEQVFENLKTSKIGREYLKFAENLPERIQFDYSTYIPEVRGENNGNNIVVYMKSNKTVEWVSRTVIHEITHYRYGIGGSQWSECVCIAHELMHKYNRNKLAVSELRRIIKAVKSDPDYGKLNWRRGGTIYGRRKSH